MQNVFGIVKQLIKDKILGDHKTVNKGHNIIWRNAKLLGIAKQFIKDGKLLGNHKTVFRECKTPWRSQNNK